ncbi:MAG TPA: DUF881 domain-containing protein [Symbiobacteriaceae bacterium]
MRTRHLPWAIALVCLVLGYMLSMQFKVQRQVALNTAGLQRAQELAAELEKSEEERKRLMSEVEDLRSQITAMAKAQDRYAGLAKQLELAQVHAGLVAVKGPGVTITMKDSTRPILPGENPNNYIIHDEDVLKTVNDLVAAGAEAIAINGQRLIATSEIRCAGPTITINGVRTAPPIVITAVGDPTVLSEAITMRGGVADQLKPWGIEVTVKTETEVTVPAYKGSMALRYGTPVMQEVSEE